MTNLSFTQAQLDEANAAAQKLKSTESVEKILLQVDEAMKTAMKSLREGKPTSKIMVYVEGGYPSDEVTQTVAVLKAKGFRAKYHFDEGYDDGPNRSTPPSDIIIIELA